MRTIGCLEKGKLELIELKIPQIEPCEALVKVEACGICNSTDQKLLKGEFFPGPFPIILGHEAVGTVVETGKDVVSYSIGDRVLRSVLKDRHVYGGGRSLWGGFSEYTVIDDLKAMGRSPEEIRHHPQQVIPKDIKTVHAPVLIPLKELYNGLSRCSLSSETTLAIVGTGPVAQNLSALAVLMGIPSVTVIGRKKRWESLFHGIGVDYRVIENPEELCSGHFLYRKFHRVIEAVGSRSALSVARLAAKSEGKIMLYGIPALSNPYSKEQIADPRNIAGIVCEAEAHKEILHLIDSGKLDLSSWVDKVFTLGEFEKAFNLFAGENPGKIVINFRE